GKDRRPGAVRPRHRRRSSAGVRVGPAWRRQAPGGASARRARHDRRRPDRPSRWHLYRRPPGRRPQEHDAMRALEGIKIIELARVAPGEFSTMMLADMGADVLKIETPPSDGGDTDHRRAAYTFFNRNKRSLALNLKTP